MKRKDCWALKMKYGKFVNKPITNNFWEGDKTMLFRSKRTAQEWLDSNQFWKTKAEVVKVIVTIKEYGE